VEDANAGTLFLDEIGEVSPALQAKLLRFLQDKGFERVGETRTRHSDVRIVAATHRDLDSDVAAGRFRPDLLYRLNVIELEVPALRHRLEDLPALIRHFLHFHATSLGRPVPELAPEAEAVLLAYGWPGNLRELRNEMERAVVLSRGSVLLPESFSERIRRDLAPVPRLGGDFSLRQIEREHTLGVLERASTREEAARTLGIDPSTLWRRLRRWEEG
jgi:NtrC-family two-component system response regulator AlgB